MGSEMRLSEALTETARELCERVGGDGCGISRMLGDVLILFAEHTPGGTLQLGQGFLVSDYPMTEDVLRNGLSYRMTLDDPDVDPEEAKVVGQLGFGALLMLPFGDPPDPWGLVEVYRRSTEPFDDGEVQTARELVTDASRRLVGR